MEFLGRYLNWDASTVTMSQVHELQVIIYEIRVEWMIDENFEMSPFIEKSPMVWKDFQKLTKQVIGNEQLGIDYYNPNRRRQLKFKKRRNSILLWLIPMLSTIVYILIPKWTSIVYLVAIGQRLDQKMKFLKWNLNWNSFNCNNRSSARTSSNHIHEIRAEYTNKMIFFKWL